MILIDNLNILKSSYPDIWNQLKQFEDKENRILTEIEETRNGDKTLAITKDDKKVYLHSKYNPLKEAEIIVESLEGIDENTNIIFYGTGLGYQIQLILEKYKDIKYYIYEPIPELLYLFFSNVNLRNLKANRLMGINTNFSGNSMDKFMDRNRDKIKVVELPSHTQNFPEEMKEFNDTLLKIIKGKRRNLRISDSLQKRWTINSMENLKELLSTPNIILEKKGEFKGKTAILVAAGPSLNEEIENLRYIKDNGLAYIFSVGSAINTLIHNEIYPDAITSFDPKVGNQKVFKVIKDKNIVNIPLIFGSSIGYESLIDYPSARYHMITSPDTVSPFYLKNSNGESISIMYDAPTVAAITLQLLILLGFNHIILVGQNLAYKDKKRHSKGIKYSKDVTDEELQDGVFVKDVYGNEILTSEEFNAMRQQIEIYIKLSPDTTVINTTKGGANIEGTKFVELKEIIDSNLNEKVVEENWLDGNKTSYDKKYLISQSKSMDISYANAMRINKEYKTILTKIEKAINNKNFYQAENLYVKLDREFKRIENNDFYKTFVLPMNRVQYKILVDSIDDLNEERNPNEKGKRILDSFKRFMDICTTDIEMIEPIYDKMKETINNFLQRKEEIFYEEANSNS